MARRGAGRHAGRDTGTAADDTDYRDEAPRWVDDDTLLFARLDAEGRLSLWTIDTDGTNLQRVIDDITPAPDWFGFYGHIDWDDFFVLWQPAMAERMMAQRAAHAELPLASTPFRAENYYALTSFLEHMHQHLTQDEALAIWGEPEIVTNTQDGVMGDRLTIYQYALNDGLKIRLGFLDDGPLTFVQLQNLDGRVYALTPLENLVAPVTGDATPPSLFGTATPIPTASPLVAPPTPTPTPTPR